MMFFLLLASGGSTGGGAAGAVAPPEAKKNFFFIALQQARPAVRRNFMATWNKTVIINASLRPECKKTHLHSVIRNVFPICTPQEAYLGPSWMSVYFVNVLALGSEALASTVYLIVMTSCLCKHMAVIFIRFTVPT